VTRGVIIDFESGARNPQKANLAGSVTRQADIDALQAALEKAGVEFIEDGVKLRKSKAALDKP
jgi:hypothetical protein